VNVADRWAVTPTVFYQRPKDALRWLETAFGFETNILVTDSEGNVAHAEMTAGGAEIGVGGEWSGEELGGARMLSPRTAGGVCTQFIWITLPSDIDGHCERARSAGATIAQDPADQFYGDRTYRALDLEGHVWCFRQRVRAVSDAEMEAATGLTVKTGLRSRQASP
jgi:uncharacterized glyoxalase superfamily protein PhnB